MQSRTRGFAPSAVQELLSVALPLPQRQPEIPLLCSNRISPRVFAGISRCVIFADWNCDGAAWQEPTCQFLIPDKALRGQ